MSTDEVRTAYLGKFDEFEAQIVVELLEGAGIFAYTKVGPTDNEHVFYAPQMESERGIVLVDATKVEEARRLVDEELPKHLESIRESMDALESGESGTDAE
jgi:tRNA G26 N,N-dimethylase Trm1